MVVAVEGFLIDPTEYRAVDYRFLEINPAFELITGLKASELVGRTVLTALPETEQYWIDTYAAVVATRTPITYRNHSSELNKQFEVRAFSPEHGMFATLVTES